MGYAYGIRWDALKIESAIYDVMKKAKINYMPTHSLIKEIIGNFALSNAIRRSGGTRYWADKLNLDIRPCESELGYSFENECINQLSKLGYECDLSKAGYPYDVMANKNIKIDVKCSQLYKGPKGSYYTFNLEKKLPTCDVFICYCLNEDKIQKVYIIPSCITSGKCQLSIGVNESKYDQYKNNWEVLKEYDAFYKSLLIESGVFG